MKFIKYLFVAVCLFIGTQANSYAQTKIGHLNSLDLLNSMPEWKAAETQYQTYLEQLSNMLKSKDEELIKEAQRWTAMERRQTFAVRLPSKNDDLTRKR